MVALSISGPELSEAGIMPWHSFVHIACELAVFSCLQVASDSSGSQVEVHLLLPDGQIAQAERLLSDAIDSGQLAQMLAASGMPLDFLGLGSSWPPRHTASWLAPTQSAQQTAPAASGAVGGSDRDMTAIVGGVLGSVIALLLAGTTLGCCTHACRYHASLTADVALLLSTFACVMCRMLCRLCGDAGHCMSQSCTNIARCCRCG